MRYRGMVLIDDNGAVATHHGLIAATEDVTAHGNAGRGICALRHRRTCNHQHCQCHYKFDMSF